MDKNQGLHTGTLLQNGKYEIADILGQGGFGITYLAKHTLLDIKVAIKELYIKDICGRIESTNVVATHTSTNQDYFYRFREKFLKEARNIAKLNHPNIVRVSDVFEENSTAYYVMDYIDGESLGDMVRQRGCIPESEAVLYIKEVGNTLSYLHSLKINHLDIKPNNIMKRRQDGQVFVIDFGVSKQYDPTTLEEDTMTTRMCVSPGYSPSEQYLIGGVSSFSPQADVYALAATLYKLLTGQTLPEAETLHEEGLDTSLLRERKCSERVIGALEAALQSSKTRTKTVKLFLQGLTHESSEENTITNVSDKKDDFADLLNHAEQGDVESIYKVGDAYFYGNGVEQNYKKAVLWYKKASKLGHAGAQCSLGYCFEYGYGVEKNRYEAFEWYEKSAKNGNKYAQCNLGYCLENREGCKKNKEEALVWYQRSADQGHERAIEALARCYEFGIGVKKNYDEAFKWYCQLIDKAPKKKSGGLKKKVERKKTLSGHFFNFVDTICYIACWFFFYIILRLISNNFNIENESWGIYVLASTFIISVCYLLFLRFHHPSIITQYKQGTNNGDPEAQYMLGYCYLNGHGVKRDSRDARYYYHKAALQGDVDAMYMVAYIEDYCKASYKHSMLWYRLAAKYGDVSAKRIYNQLNESILARLWKRICHYTKLRRIFWTLLWILFLTKGYAYYWSEYTADGWAHKGHDYEIGDGVEKDLDQAMIWYKKAAEEGSVRGQNRLAWFYHTGTAVKKDCKKAVEWYTKAAEQGDESAQFYLALHYNEGEGVEQNYEEAVKWYKRAAEQGDASSQCNLGVCYECGHGVALNYEEAVYWYRKSAEQEDACAETNLGYMYMKGLGVDKSQKQGAEWITKAAERGELRAQFYLGICYYYGCGVSQNVNEAKKWLKQATDKDYKIAEEYLKDINEGKSIPNLFQ